MTILFKLATRSRPQKCFDTLDNIFDNCGSPNFKVLLSIDKDDRTMNTIYVHGRLLGRYDPNKLFVSIGNSTSKIQAINEGVNEFKEPWDILVNVSDDQVFIKKGFDNDIRQAFGILWPELDLDKFIHFPDQATGDRLCTLSMMGKTYYSRTNYIYHPAYYSLFCDNEATEVSQLLGRYVFVDKQIFEHRHPAWGLSEKDALLKRNEKFWKIDKATYQKRKAKNFDLNLK